MVASSLHIARAGRPTPVVADRGCAPQVSGAIFDNLALSKESSGSNPPRQLNTTMGRRLLAVSNVSLRYHPLLREINGVIP